MTALMLLGIVPAGSATPVGAEVHVLVPAGGHIGLAVDVPPDLDLASEAATVALAQVQHALLCRYAEAVDVLPVALGSLFSGADSLCKHLLQRAAAIDDLARRLEGRIEYSLTINMLPTEAKLPSAASGRDHLRQRAQVRDDRTGRSSARREFLGALSESLKSSTEARHLVTGQDPSRLARINLLLRRGRLADCQNHLEAALSAAKALDLVMTLTGPYPAFSFPEGAPHG